MKRPRSIEEIEEDIKRKFIIFNKEELFDYIKWVIANLHYDIKDGTIDETKTVFSTTLQKKLEENRQMYKLTSDTDRFVVQYIDIYNCIEDNGVPAIQLYVLLNIYDDVSNNQNNNMGTKNRFWNDAWIITCKEDTKKREKFRCMNCGAYMKYNDIKDRFDCHYCGDVIFTKPKVDWLIDDIRILMD